jgi:hypothetical protein
MARSDELRNKGRRGGFGSLSEKNYYDMKNAQKPTGNLTAAQMKTKLERANKDNKRGMTKEEARNHGLTGDAGRKAAVKRRADEKVQSKAVDAEAKRKAEEKKKTDRVDTAVTAASIVGGTGLLKVGGRAAVTAAKKAGFNNVKDYKKYLQALRSGEKGRRSGVAVRNPKGQTIGLNKKLSETAKNTPIFGGRLKRRIAQQEKAKEAVAKKRASGKMSGVGTIDMKKGGLVKKKGIDGIAMRGKTKATRSR